MAITDGVTDTVGEDGERFGLGRLQAMLEEVRQSGRHGVVRQRLGVHSRSSRSAPRLTTPRRW